MGFSYVVAVAVLLSSSLIFFGMIYSDYIHAETEINNAQKNFDTHSYDYMNSQVNVTGYNYSASGSNYSVTLNVTNTGSVSFDMADTDLLVNGTLVNYTYNAQYLFPLGKESMNFLVANGSHNIEIVFDTGYEKFVKVTV